MTILPNGAAVVDGDTHHAVWCAEKGLVNDRWFADEICKHIEPGDVVIDGGANIGTLTRAMLDAGAKVHAFEPNADAVECLQRNCKGALIYGFALGESSYSTSLHHDVNAGASFLAHGEPQSGTHVYVRRLDLFCLQPALIKLDVEGYEVKALRGARDTIERCKPVLIVEVNRFALERAGSNEAELLGLIEELGYSVRVMQPQCAIGDPQYDVECLP